MRENCLLLYTVEVNINTYSNNVHVRFLWNSCDYVPIPIITYGLQTRKLQSLDLTLNI